DSEPSISCNCNARTGRLIEERAVSNFLHEREETLRHKVLMDWHRSCFSRLHFTGGWGGLRKAIMPPLVNVCAPKLGDFSPRAPVYAQIQGTQRRARSSTVTGFL